MDFFLRRITDFLSSSSLLSASASAPIVSSSIVEGWTCSLTGDSTIADLSSEASSSTSVGREDCRVTDEDAGDGSCVCALTLTLLLSALVLVTEKVAISADGIAGGDRLGLGRPELVGVE